MSASARINGYIKTVSIMLAIGIAYGVVCLVAGLLLMGCTDPEPQDHTPPDLGPCARWSARPVDGGYVGHILVYPNGHPCEGGEGTCQDGECEPEQGSRARVR